jgi:type I restriction enzyme, S subunit
VNPTQLLAHFSRIVEAENSISHLRKLIIHLAITGKLARHEEDGRSGEDFYLDVQTGIANLASTHHSCRWTASTPISSAEKKLDLPPKWTWARLNDTGLYVNGIAFAPADWKTAGIPIIRIQNLSDDTKEFNFTEGNFPDENLVREGDLLVSWSATLDAFIWRRREAVVNQHIFKVIINENAAQRDYLYWLLKHEIRQLAESDHAHGLAMMHINRGPFLAHVIALPPLAEQHRIITKVNELMALCDRLEAARNKRESRREQVVRASLYNLTNDSNVQASRESARFYLEHLPQVTTTVAQVQELRKTILNLAVRGQLVSQDSSDESVATLLVQNDEERRAIAKGDRRADVERQVLLAAESRWNIPPSWDWCALADLVLFIDYRGKTPTKKQQGVRLITAKNVRKGFINISPEEFLSETDYRAWMTRGLPKEGDVLFTTEAPMGNAAVVRMPGRFALAQRIICFRPYGAVSPEFLTIQLLAEHFQSILNQTATGLTAKGIKAAKLRRLPVAIPPVAEQLRIVSKVDELMALCERLDLQLTTAQVETSRLLEAVLHQSLAEAS